MDLTSSYQRNGDWYEIQFASLPVDSVVGVADLSLKWPATEAGQKMKARLKYGETELTEEYSAVLSILDDAGLGNRHLELALETPHPGRADHI